MKKVYLDNAATTPLSEEVIDAMVSVLKNNFGNPSSSHSFGQEAKVLIENVRRQAAEYLNVSPAEIVFTSCGTESNNMVIKSCVEHLDVQRIITSPMEHKCVAETIIDLKKRKNIEVVYLRPNKSGDIDLQDLEEKLKNSDKKTLVSLMHANNEVGNLLDIEKVAHLCKDNGALFHTDTVQTMAHYPMDFSKIPVDFASCSAHKFHGPKGNGFAFIRKNSKLKSLITGGPQERSLRAGTENVCGIVGLGKALELAIDHMEAYRNSMEDVKAYAIQKLEENIPGIIFNGRSGDMEKSLYTLVSVLLPFKEPLIGMKLDMKGIAVSQGSACSSGASTPSMVMMMLLDEDQMSSGTTLIISLRHMTTRDEIDYFIENLKLVADEHLIEKVNN